MKLVSSYLLSGDEREIVKVISKASCFVTPTRRPVPMETCQPMVGLGMDGEFQGCLLGRKRRLLCCVTRKSAESNTPRPLNSAESAICVHGFHLGPELDELAQNLNKWMVVLGI